MRKELLIASLIIIILGFAISGVIGSILLGVGILLLIYVLFSRGISRESEARYVEPAYNPNKKTGSQEPSRPQKSSARYIDEPQPKPKYKNVDLAERELKAWGSGGGKRCSSCGSTSNPADAKFCADCGKKL